MQWCSSSATIVREELRGNLPVLLMEAHQQPLGAPDALRTEINDLDLVVAWLLADQWRRMICVSCSLSGQLGSRALGNGHLGHAGPKG